MKKLVIGILLIGISALAVGCARTVTQREPTGNRMVIAITFAGTVDSTTYPYYIILGTQSFLVPYPQEYFFGPGEAYDPNRFNIGTNLDYYYQHYFSNFSDVILLKDEYFNVTCGPFINASAHFQYQPTPLTPRLATDPRTITLTIDFNRLNLSTIPNILYFNFVTIDPTGCNGGGYLKDALLGTQYISTVAGATISNATDLQGDTNNPALDIISWSVTIQ